MLNNCGLKITFNNCAEVTELDRIEYIILSNLQLYNIK